MFNADLMTTLQRIRSNEAKLAQIAQRRKELELEAKKRILPLAESQAGPVKKSKVEKVFKWTNLSKPKAEIEAKFEVLALEVVQLDLASEKGKGLDLAELAYSTRNDHAMLLVGGDAFGNVLVWDVFKDFANVKSIVLREGGNTNQVKRLEFPLELRKESEKGDEKKPEKVKDVPYAVATVGHDLFVIDLVDLDILYSKEDTFRSEVQAIVPVVSEEKVICATLEQGISCYCGKTWQSLFTLVGHSESVLCLCYVPPDQNDPKSYRVLSGSDDATIRVWDVAAMVPKAEAKRVELHEKRIAEGTKKPDVVKAKKKSGGKGEEGGSETEEEEEDASNVPELEECEKVLTHHSEFVSTICCIAARDTPSKETLILTGSGDFKICVLNRKWECIHVLGNDKFAKSIMYVQPWFFLVYQTSLEEDEDMSFLQTFDTGNQADPLKWKTSKSHHRLMRESKALAQGINMHALMPKPAKAAEGKAPAKAPKVFPFVTTSASDKAVVQVWISPFRHKPPPEQKKPVKTVSPPKPEASTKTAVPPTQTLREGLKLKVQPSPPVESPALGSASSASSAVKATTIGLGSLPSSKRKESPGPRGMEKAQLDEERNVSKVIAKSKSSTSYSGDVIAKKFAANILLIPDISPDMQRLLRCCVELHEE